MRLHFAIIFGFVMLCSCSRNGAPARVGTITDTNLTTAMTLNSLTPEEQRVILDKGTERPFTGRFYAHHESGVYTCRQCNQALFRSADKFDSGCGWPSFDDEIPGAVDRRPDPDGRRTEIVCSRCGGHLGHVFSGENFTDKNTRHCVNSISLDFVPANLTEKSNQETAYFAGGCFWGVEYYLKRLDGVISTDCGYMGGHTENPDYESVCSHTTGHAEVVRVIFDPQKTNFETVCKAFFEIHDPTQHNRQGPDVGDQYRSEIYHTSSNQEETASKLIGILRGKGYQVCTRLTPAGPFFEAESYHQEYYDRKGGIPYCHRPEKRF